jgi:hypothetical protein
MTQDGSILKDENNIWLAGLLLNTIQCLSWLTKYIQMAAHSGLRYSTLLRDVICGFLWSVWVVFCGVAHGYCSDLSYDVTWLSLVALRQISAGARFQCRLGLRFEWFYSDTPGECRDNVMVMERPFPSESFPIRHKQISLPLDALPRHSRQVHTSRLFDVIKNNKLGNTHRELRDSPVGGQQQI